MDRSFRKPAKRTRPRRPEQRPDPETLNPSVVYAIVAALSGLFVTMWLSPGDMLSRTLLVVFFAVMIGVRFWAVGLIFLMIQVGLFVVEPGSIGAFVDSRGSSLAAIGVLALLISSCRYLTLTSSPSPYRLSNRSSFKVAMQHIRRVPRGDFARFGVLSRDASTVSSMEVVTMLLRIVISVVAVSVLLAAVPLQADAAEYARLIPPAVRAVTLGVILLLIFVLANSLMNVLSWRRLSSSEAKVFLRSELSKWIHREVSAVSRRRIRFRTSRRR
jgi:hypothetical protein